MEAASEAADKLNHERGKVSSAAARQRKAVTEWERGGNEAIGGLERGRIEVGFIGNIPYKYSGNIMREGRVRNALDWTVENSCLTLDSAER